MITGGPNLTCVAEVSARLSAAGLPTTHMISVGGWDAPHPDTSFSADEWWEAWRAWNDNATAPGFSGFDGIDWVGSAPMPRQANAPPIRASLLWRQDLEGNDAPTSPWNTFSVECLKLVSDFSKRAKVSRTTWQTG